MRLNGITIGEFDRLIVIEQPTLSKDSVTNEQLQVTWSTFVSVWAKFMGSSDDKIEADQKVAVTNDKWLTRYASGVNETMRINDNSVYHYIKGIDRTDRGVTLLIKTEKRNNV